MTRILGIDPGSRITGYGIIDVDRNHNRHVASGHLRIEGASLAHRLQNIFQGISEIIDQHRPDEMAIERVFMHRNAESALKLGQARGAAICAAGTLQVAEYSAREIKLAVVGKGAGSKEQVQHMVKVLLNLDAKPQADEADALGVALCHGHASMTLSRIPQARQVRGGRLR
jgi:crossover junction endodeoxyribonuclease RuvC